MHVIFVRHGERADQIDEDEQEELKANSEINGYYHSAVEHDTALTTKGFQQATEAANYFAMRIDQFVRDRCGGDATQHEIKIESSPFLRCLQTGSRIAKNLNVDSIHVNNRLCE